MFKRNVLLSAAALLCAGLVLSGCEEEEQDRVLMYEPGVYKGQEDSGLTEEQLNELRFRMQGQGGG